MNQVPEDVNEPAVLKNALTGIIEEMNRHMSHTRPQEIYLTADPNSIWKKLYKTKTNFVPDAPA